MKGGARGGERGGYDRVRAEQDKRCLVYYVDGGVRLEWSKEVVAVLGKRRRADENTFILDRFRVYCRQQPGRHDVSMMHSPELKHSHYCLWADYTVEKLRSAMLHYDSLHFVMVHLFFNDTGTWFYT